MSSSSKKEDKSSQREGGVKRKQDEERNAEVQTEEEYKPKRIRLLVESDQSKKEIEVTMNVMETEIKERGPTESQETTSTAIEKRKHVEEEDNDNDDEKEDQPKAKKSKKSIVTTAATSTKSTELAVIRLTSNELYTVLINGLRDNKSDDEEGMIKEAENPPIDATTTTTTITTDTTIDIAANIGTAANITDTTIDTAATTTDTTIDADTTIDTDTAIDIAATTTDTTIDTADTTIDTTDTTIDTTADTTIDIANTTIDAAADIDDVTATDNTPSEESEYYDASDVVEETKYEEASNVEEVNPQNIGREDDPLQDDTEDENKTVLETFTSTTELPPTTNTIIPTITITDTTTTDATNIQPTCTIQEAKETPVFRNSLRVESSVDGSLSATKVQKKLPHSINNDITPVTTTATSTSDKALNGTEVSNSPAFTTVNELRSARSIGQLSFKRLSKNAAPTDSIRSPSSVTAIGSKKSLYSTTVDFTTRLSNATHVDSIRRPSNVTTINSIRRQADITPISTRPSGFTTVRNERPSNTTHINDIFRSALSYTPTGRRAAITEKELKNLNYFEKDLKGLRKQVEKET